MCLWVHLGNIVSCFGLLEVISEDLSERIHPTDKHQSVFLIGNYDRKGHLQTDWVHPFKIVPVLC